MFSRKHQKQLQSVHFASWTTDAAEQWGIQDALNILETCLAECQERPIAEEEMREALSFLSDRGPRSEAFARQFRTALQLPHPEQRHYTAAAALRKLREQFCTSPLS
jgi:hypothetical protein